MKCERRVSAVRSKDPAADAEKHVQMFNAIENTFRNILIRHTSISRVEAVPGMDGGFLVVDDGFNGPRYESRAGG